jgi:hypothetical protein
LTRVAIRSFTCQFNAWDRVQANGTAGAIVRIANSWIAEFKEYSVFL